SRSGCPRRPAWAGPPRRRPAPEPAPRGGRRPRSSCCRCASLGPCTGVGGGTSCAMVKAAGPKIKRKATTFPARAGEGIARGRRGGYTKRLATRAADSLASPGRLGHNQRWGLFGLRRTLSMATPEASADDIFLPGGRLRTELLTQSAVEALQEALRLARETRWDSVRSPHVFMGLLAVPDASVTNWGERLQADLS